MAIEGRSGAGKTVLAKRVADVLGCPVVHMDDLYPGWEGLAASVPLVREWVLEPLSRGRDPRLRRYDWEHGRYAGWEHIPVGATLLIEGCGSGARELRAFLSLLVWVEAPDPIRQQRLAKRWDAEVYAPHRSMWAAQEEAFYAEHHPRAHADLVIGNTAAATGGASGMGT